MKKIALVLVFFAFNITLAQIPEWTWAKNISVLFNNNRNMTAVDNEGNVYLVGDFNTPSVTIGSTTLTNLSDVGYSDGYVIKFSSTGNLIWTKQISTNAHDSVYSIDTDDSGNVYISGSFGNTLTLGSTTLIGNLGGTFIAKLNSSGTYLWAKRSNSLSDYYVIQDLKSDNSGNVYLTGYMMVESLSFDSVVMEYNPISSNTTNFRCFVAKFDTNGTCLWGKMGISNDENPMGAVGNSIAPDNSGGLVICGRFSNNSINFGSILLTKHSQNNDSPDMFVAKYDNNGNEIWAYNAGSILQSAGGTSGQAVTIDSNNNVYTAGYYTTSIEFGSTILIPWSGSQFYLLKYNPAGDLLWAKSTEFSTNGFTSIQSLDTDENGNLYAAGMTYASTIAFNNTVTLNNLGNVGAFFVAKYNASGNAIWAKGVGNIDANNQISLDCKAENDLFVGGTFDKSTLLLGNNLLIKSTASNDLFIGHLNTLPLNTLNFDTDHIKIYPNPAREIVHLDNLKTNYTFKITNVIGTCVKEGFISNERESINVSSLQVGLYLIQVTDLQGKSIQSKLLIE